MSMYTKRDGSATILDFNGAGRQVDTFALNEIDVDDIKDRLKDRACDFVEWMYSGRAAVNRARTEARIGDVGGEAGASLSICLSGNDAGLWKDHATDEGGDLITLYRLYMNHAESDFIPMLKEIAKDFLGDPIGEIERPAGRPSPQTVIKAKKAKLGDKPRAEDVELLGAPSAIYYYYDLQNKIVAKVLRFELDGTDEHSKPRKTFRPYCFREIDGRMKWTTGAPESDRPLYQLPKIANMPAVILVEGEKCADALISVRIAATTAMSGAGAPIDKTDWTPLINKEIVIWPDNDQPSFKWAERVANHLLKLGCTVRGVDPPTDVGVGWDAADCIKEGRDPQELIDSAKAFSATSGGTSAATSSRPRLLLTLDEWRARDLPKPDFLQGEVFHTTNRSMASAKTGIGKTNLALAIGMRMSSGLPFLHWRSGRACKVLYIDGEMSRRLLKERLILEEERVEVETGKKPTGFHALSREDLPDMQPLNTREGQAIIDWIITEIGGVDFLILDNIQALIVGSMIEEQPWAETLPWVKALTRRCIGQLWLHHTGYNETRAYGTSTRAWQLDNVINLTEVENPSTDISFELKFDKARERSPQNRADYQTVAIRLVGDEWLCDAAQPNKKGPVSPLGQKYFEALVNVVASGPTAKSKQLHGRHAVHYEDWKAECEVLGLLDPAGLANVQRAKFYKYRTELVVANRIACHGDHSWVI
jgi:hypothetical protein